MASGGWAGIVALVLLFLGLLSLGFALVIRHDREVKDRNRREDCRPHVWKRRNGLHCERCGRVPGEEPCPGGDWFVGS